jgi:hypothetical protein
MDLLFTGTGTGVVAGGSNVAGVPFIGAASGLGPGAGAATTGETVPGVRCGMIFLTRSFVRSQMPERRGARGVGSATGATVLPAASKLAGRGFGRAQLQPPTPASMFPSIQF